MANRKSPLRERLLSNSPDPIKSSILRESGMGWNPNPQPQNTGSVSSTSSADSLISPLRIEKRDTPVRPRGPPIPRRTSSSYKHMHSNNLVSKSPFKSQIPAPASSAARPEQPIAISFPLTPSRRVSGEKRQRPSSMHELAETENSRPFALKRERKQSKAFEVLLEKEAVTKSPFRVAPPEPSDDPKPSAIPIPIPKRRPVSVPPPDVLLRPETPSSQPSTSPRPSPGRSALVSRRMHGPRLSGSGRRERRKTVTFDERCDVVEFDRDYDSDGDVFASSEEEDGSDENSMEYEPQQIEIPTLLDEETEMAAMEQDIDQDDDASYEDVCEGTDDKKGGSMLDPDASITGLVDNLFFNRQDQSLVDSSFASATNTPPRHSSLPPDLETEGGVPLGRSHHVERFLQHHSPHLGPQRISPKSSPGGTSPGRYPFSLNLPTQASPNGPPATPPRRSPGMTHSTPPLGRSTHAERVKEVRDQENDEIAQEVGHLPPSPSPMKRQVAQERTGDALIPRFELGQETNSPAHGDPDPSCAPDPFARSRSLDEARSVEREASPSVEEPTLATTPHCLGADMEHEDLSRNDESAFHDAEGGDESDEDAPTEVDVLADVAAAVSISPRPAGSPGQRSGSPLVRGGSPLTRLSSPSTNALQVNRPRINKDDVKRRLMGRRSFCSPSPEPRSPERSVDHKASPLLHSPEITPYDSPALNALAQEQDRDKGADRMSIMTGMTDMSTDTAIVAHAERGSAAFATLVTPQEVDEDNEFGVIGQEDRLKFDFGSKFSLGLGMASRKDDIEASSIPPTPGMEHGFRVGDHDVDIDMNSALDRLMEDVAGGRVDDSLMADDSILSNDTYNSEESEAVEVLLNTSTTSRPQRPTRSETEPSILPSHVASSSNAFASGSAARSSPIPPVPPKDSTVNAREARERLILQKRRQARGIYENDSEDEDGDDSMGPIQNRRRPSVGRASHRRTMSVGDVETLTEHQKNTALLELGDVDSDNLLGNIEQALSKMKEEPKKKRYNVRERQNTIYASASDDKVTHLAGAGDIDTGRPWRAVRRPSDMNQYAKEIREYRAQDKSKAYGKVFVKVLGLKNVCLPMPREPTAVTCTLNNGIHFVTTPDCQLNDQNCTIEQEFELIEHSKLEFTLTIKVRRDPHIITQFKALAAPPPRAAPAPAPIPLEKVHTKSSSRFSLFSTPKKHRDRLALTPVPTPPLQSAQPHHLPENLARYLKPDGTLARAFIAFKDVIHRCDTRLFETSYPLIGQRAELGGKFSTQQVGEIVIQMFRLPPLPGVPPEDLPQSLEECHRGLRHINWHKVTYFQGTLTQNGGDCSTWRRRHFRVIGGMLVAFNDVTKKATATIELSKAIRLEDDNDRDDESLYGVERSFRLFFPNDEEIVFFADTDDEKNKWLEIFRALVGHIPPHPLWGELLWQRQEEIQKRAQAARTTATTYDPPASAQFLQ